MTRLRSRTGRFATVLVPLATTAAATTAAVVVAVTVAPASLLSSSLSLFGFVASRRRRGRFSENETDAVQDNSDMMYSDGIIQHYH